MPKAILVDLRKCTGCRGCQVACKQWNELPAVSTTNRGTYENPPDLSAHTWSVLKFKEISVNGNLKWLFSKWQCMHCLQPA
ncbi:MAG: 4Fe-4S dicluster domain-containing protein, partial [Dehalococcoidales bacterium]